MKSSTKCTCDDFFVMDIETNTIYDVEKTPVATWLYLGNIMSSKDEKPIFFHTWEEYATILDELKPTIIYVHNLSYEFEFLCRNGFHFSDIIANTTHKPIKVTDSDRQIEYRCSYMLLDKSVRKLGELFKLPKLEYQYDGVRSRENLTPKDYEYNARDCQIVIKALKNEIKQAGGIAKLPLTKTGKVRILNIKNDESRELRSKADKAFPPKNVYDMLEMAFNGGYSGGNAEYFGKIVENVYSFDKKSSYPATMLEHQFPMKFGKIRENATPQFEKAVKEKQHFVAYLHIDEMLSKDRRFCVYSESKINIHAEDVTTYNGKIYHAYDVYCCVDSVTWEMLNKCYYFTHVSALMFCPVTSMCRLPIPLLRTIAELAKEKERIGKLVKSGHDELEQEYMHNKEMLNSEYGANVQKFRDFVYSVNDSGEWETEIMPYKKPRNLSRVFAWGVWITAYSKKDLIDSILEIGVHNWVYSDTDSDKTRVKLPKKEYFSPETVDFLKAILTPEQWDAVKNFGKFEEETKNFAEKFMHLGAKKYFTEKKGKFGYTIAGFPKSENAPKSWDDIEIGREYYPVKLAKKFVNNQISDTMYYKSGDKYIPYTGKVNGKGGVALYDCGYTLNVTANDMYYCEEYGYNLGCHDSLTNVENFNVTEFLYKQKGRLYN